MLARKPELRLHMLQLQSGTGSSPRQFTC